MHRPATPLAGSALGVSADASPVRFQTPCGRGRGGTGAAALLGFCLTVPRWRHQWAYEWLLTAWGFRRVTPARSWDTATRPDQSRQPWTSLPAIDVAPVRVRSGAEAGVVHDGGGCPGIVPPPPNPPCPFFPAFHPASLARRPYPPPPPPPRPRPPLPP